MKMVDLVNYHDIFSNNFTEEERKDFILNYESCLRDLSFYALHPDMSGNPVNDFLKKYEDEFKHHENLLRQILLIVKPRELYAIMELCD